MQKSENGQFESEEWGEDLLTCALGTQEHSGRVRGVGAYISPSMYFKMPFQGGKVSKMGKKGDISDARMQISQQNEMIALLSDRLMKLEEAIAKDKETEGKGSCSVKQACRILDEDLELNEEDDEMIVMQKVDTKVDTFQVLLDLNLLFSIFLKY